MAKGVVSVRAYTRRKPRKAKSAAKKSTKKSSRMRGVASVSGMSRRRRKSSTRRGVRRMSR